MLSQPGPSSRTRTPRSPRLVKSRPRLPARAPRLSRRSRCTPSPGGPTLGTERPVAPESSRRTRPGRRRGSGGWRGGGRTPSGTRCRSGCPGRGPSRLGVLRLSPGLGARGTTTGLLMNQQRYLGQPDAHPEVCRWRRRQLPACSGPPPRPSWLSGCLPPPLRRRPATLQRRNAAFKIRAARTRRRATKRFVPVEIPRLWKQASQTLTGARPQPLSGTGRVLEEHESQKPSPHARQWCLVSLGWNSSPQL